MLAPQAAYHLHTLRLVALEGHPGGQAQDDARQGTPFHESDDMQCSLSSQPTFFGPTLIIKFDIIKIYDHDIIYDITILL